MTLPELFPHCLVINLPERADRRRETERELARAGFPPGWAEFFPAVRPDSAGGFPSVGARGCFLSHLGALRAAVERGWGSVLILEDDLELAADFAARSVGVLDALPKSEWDVLYLGHALGDIPGGGAPLRRYDGPIMTTHFLVVNGRCLGRLVGTFEAVLSRPPGHPDGGPMHVDGAYSTFRAQNPDVATFVATPSLGGQRSSRSDVSPGWKDDLPVIRNLVAVARWARGRLTND